MNRRKQLKKKDFSRGLANKSKGSKGFTLLELMIAISIFGLLMLYISQLMRQEIHLFSTATQQNEVQQKARTSMMHILDEIRLHRYTYYSPGQAVAPALATDSGVYYYDPDHNPNPLDHLGIITCLIDVNPENSSNLPAGTELYYDSASHSLWFRDNQHNPNVPYLVSDQIYSLSITPVASDLHFVKIDLVAGDPSTPQTFELLTWVRLY